MSSARSASVCSSDSGSDTVSTASTRRASGIRSKKLSRADALPRWCSSTS
jgi:hypothetical protein